MEKVKKRHRCLADLEGAMRIVALHMAIPLMFSLTEEYVLAS